MPKTKNPGLSLPGQNNAFEQGHVTTEKPIIASIADVQVAYFASLKDTQTPQRWPLSAVLDAIRNDAVIARKVARQRALLADGRKDQYDAEKKMLPLFLPHGIFSTRNAASCLAYSGLFVLDYDKLGGDIARVRSALVADPHVVACFTSPSGDGLKGLVRVDLGALPEAPDPELFRLAWSAVAARFEKLTGLAPDQSGKDLPRACFLSHDAECFYNEKAIPLPVSLPEKPVKPVIAPAVALVAAADVRLNGALRAACDAVRSAPNGTRNATLVKQSFSMGGLAGMDQDKARQALIQAGNDAGLDPGEAEEAVPRCMVEGSKAPWSLPDDGADRSEHGEDNRVASFVEYAGGHFDINEDGVHYYPPGETKDGDPHPPKWLCGPVSILASTRDARNHSWGRLLEWTDPDGHAHRWAMGADLLQTDGADVRRMLASRGLDIAPGRQARELMQVFLQRWPAPKRARCVDRTGWCGPAYVAPDRVFGESEELVVFQGDQAIDHGWSARGTLDTWKAGIGALCRGNSRLVFSVSMSLVGPLLEMTGGESGGFHLRGPSSCGKSTAQLVAASTWGRPKEFSRSWRATSNALEGIAALSNDHFLVLDELGQVDPKAGGETCYMLGNGSGKSRANRSGGARKVVSWRLIYLSSGEVALSELMRQAGHRVHAGQEVRLCDIDADAGSNMGLFEDTHGHATPERFAVALKTAADSAYGTLGPAFLDAIVSKRVEIAEMVKAGIDDFTTENLPENASGQVARVARRFGLVAAAGELAIGFGLVPWPEGEADSAAAACFRSWLAGFGAGQREDTAIISQVSAFLEANGSARFESMTGGERVINRVGFWRDADGTREYLTLPEAFRGEICRGVDAKRAARVLAEAGMLTPDGAGKASQAVTLPGLGKSRVYVLRFNSIQK